MARILVKFDSAIIKECELDKNTVTFGRKSDNDIVLDNPTVSGHHGKIIKEGNDYFVEDLTSTNGTYLNGQKIKKSKLKNKDLIGVARHFLEVKMEEGEPAAPPPPEPEPPAPQPEPVQQATPPKAEPQPEPQPAVSTPEPVQQAAPPKAEPQPEPQPAVSTPEPSQQAASPKAIEQPKPQVLKRENLPPLPKENAQPTDLAPAVPVTSNVLEAAVIKILTGDVDGKREFHLKDMVTYIGKSDQALIKLKGLLAPNLAAAISRRPEGYFLQAVKKGYPKVNGNPVNEQVLLEHGSMIEAGGVNMLFQIDKGKKQADK